MPLYILVLPLWRVDSAGWLQQAGLAPPKPIPSECGVQDKERNEHCKTVPHMPFHPQPLSTSDFARAGLSCLLLFVLNIARYNIGECVYTPDEGSTPFREIWIIRAFRVGFGLAVRRQRLSAFMLLRACYCLNMPYKRKSNHKEQYYAHHKPL
jgi:hypothetical protein